MASTRRRRSRPPSSSSSPSRSRSRSNSPPRAVIPASMLNAVLFETSRLLSVVPAVIGASINAWCVYHPPHILTPTPPSPKPAFGRCALPTRADYAMAVLWALLTAHQCLSLTTGLLRRWTAYYPPLAALIRLLALQAICWPATHVTLGVFGALPVRVGVEGEDMDVLDAALLRGTTLRPEVAWAVIGATTCVSRSVQIWVTSNLPLVSSTRTRTATLGLGPREWDWNKVTRPCVLPPVVLLALMVGLDAWRRETCVC
ncbi:hypothetical protein BJ138DRAFT_1235649 [Hygrophoropsis aurantiaca]|uniref:Uncharacterized protein n=1 Tax=Hygrophoropsis aurantiaca TaxID=72124 RepID=A0ACB8ARI7_9AGAM|nr:hypothetical protein BJ138DRAFT_1235649 [Hygrophoropsis aurantiaca]